MMSLVEMIANLKFAKGRNFRRAIVRRNAGRPDRQKAGTLEYRSTGKKQNGINFRLTQLHPRLDDILLH